jgi:hypothetical protein
MEESGRALALPHTRWPQIQSLVLIAGDHGGHYQMLTAVLDAMEGPAKLVSTVARLTHAQPTQGIA